MRGCLVFVVVLAPITAVADRADRWDFQIGAAGDASRASHAQDAGALGAAIELGYQLKDGECRTLEMTQDAQWYWRDAEHGVTTRGVLEACIDRIELDGRPGQLVDLPRILGGYDLRSAVRPQLDSPRTMRVDDYTLYAAHFDFGVFERRTTQRRLSSARVGVRMDLTLQGQDVEATTPSQSLLSLDFLGFSDERRRDTPDPLVIEAGRVGVRQEGNHDTWLLGVTPISVEGWCRGGLCFGAHGGYTYAHMARRRLHVVTGGAAIGARLGALALGLRYRREVLPAVDPIVIVDDRTTATVSYPLLGGTLAGAGFIATSRAVSVDALMPDARDLTGGGSLVFARNLSRYLVWHASFEAGRSFYARFDLPMTEPGNVVRASTGFEAKWRTR